MNRVVHFELQAVNLENMVKFYKGVFEWQFMKWDGPQEYYLVTTGEGERGIDGGMMQSPDGVARTYNTIEVSSVDAYITKVEENGGQVVMPKHAIPGVGYLAYCKDPEGTIFGLMQLDETAK